MVKDIFLSWECNWLCYSIGVLWAKEECDKLYMRTGEYYCVVERENIEIDNDNQHFGMNWNQTMSQLEDSILLGCYAMSNDE